MATDEDKSKQGGNKGFAGLSSMVSDVEETVRGTPKSRSATNTSSPIQHSSPDNQSGHQDSIGTKKDSNKRPESSAEISTTVKWLLGIAALVGIIWFANQSDTSAPSKPAYQSGTSSPPVSPPAAVARPAQTPSSPPPIPAAVPPQAPSRPVEVQPSVGRNNVLSAPEIRYCLAEKIRLDASEKVLNNYSEADVNRFNGYVNDYNSRCGEFRYRKGALESARSELEPFRPKIQDEGRSRFIRAPATETKESMQTRVPQATLPALDTTVQAVQRRLNELGYDAGPADGLIGGKTRAAIQAFQRDSGTTQDGVADASLLQRLSAAPRAGATQSLVSPTPGPTRDSPRSAIPANSTLSGTTWYCNNGYRKVGETCELVRAPVNATVSGSTWYCNNGYRKIGETCDLVRAPANASVSGSTWYCNNGYRKVGETCELVIAPANASVSGSTWYCNNGYRKVGESCELVRAPANASVSGSAWYCNNGYRKVGETCEAVKAPANASISGSAWYCNNGYRREGEKCVAAFSQ